MVKRQEERRLLGPRKSTSSAWDNFWTCQNQWQTFDSSLLGRLVLRIVLPLGRQTGTPQVKNLYSAQTVLLQEGRYIPGKGCGHEQGVFSQNI